MSLKVAELEALFTADTKGFDRAADSVEKRSKSLDKMSADLVVTADNSKALQSMDRVESSARSLPDGELEVTADTSAAESALGDIESEAGASGKRGGEDAGQGLSDGIVAALMTIPIAGAVVGVGVAAGKALMDAIEDGLSVEARSDRLAAQTGLDPDTVGMLARAAGEAYADNWGGSIEENLDTAKLAAQMKIIDPKETQRDAQSVISSLSGISDIMEEDVQRVARSTAQLMKNGLAANAEEAFDIIVKGQQSGLNTSEDWLDTIDEYSTKWRDLGLTAPEAMGLMNQAVQNGARDTDKAADALKEFQIRATDASDASAEGFRALGLDAEEMTAKIAAGGEGAKEGLGQVLDALREMEDPVARNAAAVALFGTQAEDLGDALFAMDTSNAVEQLGNVEGAAGSALSTLTDNAANEIAEAQRNIEVASDGIKGALAAAVGPQLEEWAKYVQENRGPIMSFILGLANGAIDMGRGFINGIASATESVGQFIAGPLVTINDGIIEMLHGLNAIPGIDMSGPIETLEGMSAEMSNADEKANAMAESMRTNLIENGLDPLQDRLNEVGDQLVWEAEVHDAQVALANGIDEVGYSADGTKIAVDDLVDSTDAGTTASSGLDQQLKDVKASMDAEAEAASKAGISNDDLKESLDSSVTALEGQLTALGLTEDQVEDLIEEYGLVPSEIITDVEAKTADADSAISSFISRNTGRRIYVDVSARGGPKYTDHGTGVSWQAKGSVLQPMAVGGVTGTPMDPIAQVVPPGTLRVIGDRMDVKESYIPHDGSPRSMAILLETMKAMGVQPMAAGGVTPGPVSGKIGDTYQFGDIVVQASDLPPEVVEFFKSLRRRTRQQSGA